MTPVVEKGSKVLEAIGKLTHDNCAAHDRTSSTEPLLATTAASAEATPKRAVDAEHSVLNAASKPKIVVVDDNAKVEEAKGSGDGAAKAAADSKIIEKPSAE